MNDVDFVRAVEACTVAGSDFHHADHVRLAWLYLREHELLDAIERYTTTLKRFAAHNGVAERYHATITWAFLLLIHERMEKGREQDWEAFCRANGDLFRWNPSVLADYYSPQTLASDLARKTFVLPAR